jgi:phosphoglycolate phosphatase
MRQKIKTLLESKKLLIFDCDGVLFDSHDANVAYFDEALKLCGYNGLPRTYVNKAKYMSLTQLIEDLVETEKEAHEMYHQCIKLPYDPFIPMLKPTVDFKKVFGLLSSQFRCAIVCTVDANPKPDPTMLNLCLKKTSIKKSKAVFVGDARSDCLAAQRASMDYIYVGEVDEALYIDSVEELIQEI